VDLAIRDDGQGALDGPTLGFGLLGVRERVALVGGQLQISSSAGFELRLHVPTAS
jgi:signal transduction histidine kinase